MKKKINEEERIKKEVEAGFIWVDFDALEKIRSDVYGTSVMEYIARLEMIFEFCADENWYDLAYDCLELAVKIQTQLLIKYKGNIEAEVLR